LKMKRIKINK